MLSRRPHDAPAGIRPNERSFTVEQFGELVSSALDSQHIPNDALAFEFGGNIYPPSGRSTPLNGAQDARTKRSGTFTRLRDAFARKRSSRDASRAVPPDTRRLASYSLPALSLKTMQDATSVNLDRSMSDYPSLPTTPANSTSFPSLSTPSLRSFRGSENRAYLRDPPLSETSSSERNYYTQSRSFLSLRPLTIPKLYKRSSSNIFPSNSVPTPDHYILTPPGSATGYSNSDGMRSFFDDSGYEEELYAQSVPKTRSKASFRSFFSGLSDNNSAHLSFVYKHDKALPPTPVTEERHDARQKRSSTVNPTPRQRSDPSLDRDSLFYTSPVVDQQPYDDHSSSIDRVQVRTKSEKELKSCRVPRSTSSTPHKVKRSIRHSPPPYPSPTSPLPPTPVLHIGEQPASPTLFPTRALEAECVGDTTEESIESMEILSWRMPNLDKQVSKSSSSSTAQAHALGRPSRGSIRERLGLGTRLHVHVPLPEQFLKSSTKRSRSQDRLSSKPIIPERDMTRPSTGTLNSSSRILTPRLTSASLVSLKSIATITAGSKGVYDDDHDDRKRALGVDRAFTPEDDPFAADPLTPITPIDTTFPTQTNKRGKYRSFMPLGNDSFTSCSVSQTPVPAPATLPNWHYRLGSNSNKSSPTLTPSSSIRRTATTPRPVRASTTPSSVRSSLTPSLVDALGIRRRTPSLTISSNGHHNLSHVISKLRGAQNSQIGHRKSKLSGSREGNTYPIVGHSESRPHSPFPMLFRKSRTSKASSPVAKESRRSSVSSALSTRATECTTERAIGAYLVKHATESLRIRCVQGLVEAPVELHTSEVDAHGEAARNVVIDDLRRDIVSPTAWLLDLDDDDDDAADVIPEKAEIITADPGLYDVVEVQGNALLAARGDQASAGLPSPEFVSSRRRLQTRYETESETDTEGNVTLLRASQSWPLPPYRTVIVDDVTGEGFHSVEPVVEYAQAGSISNTPRHSIRLPKRQSGTSSIASHGSCSSSTGSPASQRLSSSQARRLAEHLESPVDNDNGISTGAPSDPQVRKVPLGNQLKQRSRSAASLASASARSVKTTKTSFYSARSTASRGSDKSTFYFARSQQVSPRMLSRQSSTRSGFSSRSPTSSSSHDAKSSAGRSDSNSCSGARRDTAAEAPFSPDRAHGTCLELLSIPERIVLHPAAPNDVFNIVVSGWSRLLATCGEYGNVNIVAFDSENEFKILSVSVEEVRGSNSGANGENQDEGICVIDVTGSELLGQVSESQSRPLRLSLSLHRTTLVASQCPRVFFCLSLPATLGDVVDVLRQHQPQRTMS